MKPVVFLGSSLDNLRSFPARARRSAGYQLDRVQRGLDPDNWKPMPSVGTGVREIRLQDTSGAYRVIYITNVLEAIYVLHAFQKKRQRTLKHDLDLAQTRLRELKNRTVR